MGELNAKTYDIRAEELEFDSLYVDWVTFVVPVEKLLQEKLLTISGDYKKEAANFVGGRHTPDQTVKKNI